MDFMTFRVAHSNVIELRGEDDIMYAKLIDGVLSIRKRSRGITQDHVISVLHLVRLAYGESATIRFEQPEEKDETAREGA